MNIFSIAIFLTVSIIGANSKYPNPGVRVPQISLFPVDEISTFPGRVYDYKPCGGPGQVVDWIVEDCAPDNVCKFPVEIIKHTEYDFIPSENISQIGIRFDISIDGEHRTVMERPLENSEVLAGQRYRASLEGTATKEHKGKRVNFYYMIYRVADKSVETCVVAKYDFY